VQTKKKSVPEVDLEQLVAEADTGGRKPTGVAAQIVLWVAIAWSLFQLWYASPLPFVFGIFVFNDTEARAIHLGIALFLAYTAYPAFRSSPRKHIPTIDWGNAFPIIGVGGIMSVEDAKAKLDAGADLIQVYTGFIYEGPGFVKQILRSLHN
jgi:TRAP-type uncharacterized transport system fused permease subunit